VLAQIRHKQTGSGVSKTPARLTLAAKGNCFVLSVGNLDTLPKNVFQMNFSPEGTRERVGTPNRRKRESQVELVTNAVRRNTHRQENL
jgi:hypothetical protein